jgi:hypothetical protein
MAKQKSIYVERVWQTTDAPGYYPYAMRFAWSYPEDPAWKQHQYDLESWENEQKRAKTQKDQEW